MPIVTCATHHKDSPHRDQSVIFGAVHPHEAASYGSRADSLDSDSAQWWSVWDRGESRDKTIQLDIQGS